MVRHNKRHGSAHKRHYSARKRYCSARKRHWSALHEGTSAFAFRPPPPCARRRGTRCHNGARANSILYIRVRRREGENVLHRAASNDVDNFSVDNPLWITVAGGCRLLRGRRRRRCGGSVNAGTAFRPHDCDFTAWTGRTYIKYMRARDPLRQMCVKPADLTTHSSPTSFALPAQRHARPEHLLRLPPHSDTPSPSTSAPPRSADARPLAARCIPRRPHNPFPAEDLRPPRALPLSRTATRPERALSPRPRSADARPLAARCIPRRRPSPAPAQRHALPEHFRSPTQPQCTPTDCAMHSPPISQPIPHRRPSPAPAQRHARPFRSASGTKKRHRTVHVRCRMSRSTVVRSVIWVGEPRAVRRRCGALACRRGA